MIPSLKCWSSVRYGSFMDSFLESCYTTSFLSIASSRLVFLIFKILFTYATCLHDFISHLSFQAAMTNIGSWMPHSSGSFWWSSVQVILREWLWHLITRSSQWKSTLSVVTVTVTTNIKRKVLSQGHILSKKRAFSER